MALTPGSEIVVGVGDCRIAAAPAASIATYALGSCVAIVAWDWRVKVGGLLHAMLPDSSIDRKRAVSDPACFVDTGMTELLRGIEEKGGSRRRVRCCVAGGASMIVDPAMFEIGKRNCLAVKKAFWKPGLFIDQEDVGGFETRSLRLDLGTGRIDMKKGAGPGRVFVPAGINVFGKGENDASLAR
jgi:chemotaxis protein CheD